MKLLRTLKGIIKNKKLHTKLINDYMIKEAFVYKGVQYYMFNDPFEVSAGRGLYSMTFFEEMLARVDRDYLLYHVKAMENVLSNPSKTDLSTIVKLNDNLKERLEFQIALPEHVYKLASVIFFDKSESPFRYDADYNRKKIEMWQKDAEAYDFFLQTPLKTLIPFLQLPQEGTAAYLAALNKISQRHLLYVQRKALGKT